MIYEVAAAVEHIVSLVQQAERDAPAAYALAAFASTLKDSLERRCQKCWHPLEPERGSAYRSVAWQLHPAGEGADCDLLRAFASVVQAHAEEGEIVQLHDGKVVQLALQWLPRAFTLWIDPGCVAVRRGAGPGAARSGDFEQCGEGASAVHVVWGQMVAHAAERHAPQLTVSAARPVAIVKPTPTVAQPRYPVNLFASAAASAPRHSRSASSASSASSSCPGLVRSASLSSTVSTDATSVSDVESEACPSLCSPASSLTSTHCSPQHDAAHDTTLGDATQRFTGVRLFEDDDEAGDVTIDASPMLGLSVSRAVLADGFTPVKAVEPVKCNYTTHDNGNVGVLGGGVRLGSSRGNAAQPPRHRHSQSKSSSYAPAQSAAYNVPHHMNAPSPYSAPPSLPLPHPYHAYPAQQQHYPHAQLNPTFASYGYAPQQTFYAQPGAPDPREEGDEATGGRRLRSRGRRSRGRGAGRAARRQAAAARASQLGSTDEGDELSRCSTPATDWTSSVYSSATSSPVKGSVSKRSSHSNLRAAAETDFGHQLHSNLARLQAAAY